MLIELKSFIKTISILSKKTTKIMKILGMIIKMMVMTIKTKIILRNKTRRIITMNMTGSRESQVKNLSTWRKKNNDEFFFFSSIFFSGTPSTSPYKFAWKADFFRRLKFSSHLSSILWLLYLGMKKFPLIQLGKMIFSILNQHELDLKNVF